MPEFPPSRLLEYSNKFMSGAAIFDPKILRSKNPINSQHRQLAFRRFSTGRSASVFPTTIAGFAHTRTTPNYAQFLDLSTTLAQYPNAIWKRRNSARRTDRPCDNRRLSRKTVSYFFTNRSSARNRLPGFSSSQRTSETLSLLPSTATPLAGISTRHALCIVSA